MKYAIVACLALAACQRGTTRVALPCGDRWCDANVEYCELALTDVAALPSTYTCRPLPRSCDDAASCACFPRGTHCRSFCRPLDPGFELVCVGGA